MYSKDMTIKNFKQLIVINNNEKPYQDTITPTIEYM